MPETLTDQLSAYLSDAHSIEEQALAQLRDAPDIAGDDSLAGAFSAHLRETEEHERQIRSLLEQRSASPSRFKDLMMKLGGKGFVLFARANPDTAGKLLSHALSYEALEEASYALLAAVAREAGEPGVAETAERIQAQEKAMRERLEGCFDAGVDASLKALGDVDLGEQVGKYLADAHAIEEQALKLLERAAARDDGSLTGAYTMHLEETRGQAAALEARLDEVGRDPSTMKDALMRMGAVNWAAFFEAHPDTPGKLAAFAYAFEWLEIGGYEQLKRVAQRAGDTETEKLAERILSEERAAQAKLWSLLPEAARLSLAEVGASASRGSA
jgi:ferritin-like metal-binding protein YciE